MAQIMINIPRRKIYEKLLEFEEAVLDLQILIFSEENFQKYSKKFNENSLKILKKTYWEIKALLKMFVEHKIFAKEEDFLIEFERNLKLKKELTDFIGGEKIFPEKFKEIVKILDNELEIKEVESLDKGLKLFGKIEIFNSYIPKILEYKRNEKTKKIEK